MFQSLHLCRKLPIVKLCRNATFSELFETAYGLIITTVLEVGIDPCLFGNSNKFVGSERGDRSDCFQSVINQLGTLENLQNDTNIMKFGQ